MNKTIRILLACALCLAVVAGVFWLLRALPA